MTLTIVIKIFLQYKFIKDDPQSLTGITSPNEYLKSGKSTDSKNVLNEDNYHKVKEEVILNRQLFTEGNNADLINKEIADSILQKDESKENP